MNGSFVPTVPRGTISAMYSTPGPAYGLPGLIGENAHDPRSSHRKGPGYSFGLKSTKWKSDCSPGPVYFPETRITRVGKDGTPSYSLYSRHQEKGNFNTPGAGTYKPEDSRVMQTAYTKVPAYTFGTKHVSRGSFKTPAANYYTLPSMLGTTVQSSKVQAPNYSMTGRSKNGGFSQDLQKTPGPGNYSTVMPDSYKYKQPQYTMLGRTKLPGDGTAKPGPGSHSPERVILTKRRAPQCSFGIKHSVYTAPLIVQVE